MYRPGVHVCLGHGAQEAGEEARQVARGNVLVSFVLNDWDYIDAKINNISTQIKNT